MCGRYVLIDGRKILATSDLLKQIGNIGTAFASLPQYNAAPLQSMPVVAVRDGALTAGPMQWSLVPHWSKERTTGFSTFNAKAETLHQSKLYAPYFKGSRCLIPADAFYEWRKVAAAGEATDRKVVEKHPMCIRMKDETPFMFAGLFSVWRDAKEIEVPTFTIITTEPNDLVATIHNRMPVILDAKDFEQWLDRDYKDADALQQRLRPYPASKMKAYRVSTVVNNARNNTPDCLLPLSERDGQTSAKRG